MSHTFPILYGTDKNGKTKMWSATISYNQNNENNEVTATITFGQVDGKHQTATRVYTEGKNIGKKNETTPLQQCINETQRKWQDKKEMEGYLEENEREFEQEIKNNGTNKLAIQMNPEKVQSKIDKFRDIMQQSSEKTNIIVQALKDSSTNPGSKYYWLLFVAMYAGIYFLN